MNLDDSIALARLEASARAEIGTKKCGTVAERAVGVVFTQPAKGPFADCVRVGYYLDGRRISGDAIRRALSQDCCRETK